MKTTAEQIRKEINNKGGINSFSAEIRHNRPLGCPMKRMMIEELQELSKEELHVAFYLELIGNNNRVGSIVANSKL